MSHPRRSLTLSQRDRRDVTPVRPQLWRIRDRAVAITGPVVLGILNVTPDSFSDGGFHATLGDAVAHAGRMVDEGADILDIGGESTRPGAAPISADEELARILRVVRAVRREHPSIPISVDTTKATVARAALDAGADIVNDVTALRLDEAMAAVVSASGAGLILMHSRGGAGVLASYDLANYEGGDVCGAVSRELAEGVATAEAAGVRREAIVLDPGIGFAKRPADSVSALRGLPGLVALGRPLLVGASRKRVIATLIGGRRGDGEAAPPLERVQGSVGVHVAALALGARLFRVHDVREHREALDAAWALLGPADGSTAPA